MRANARALSHALPATTPPGGGRGRLRSTAARERGMLPAMHPLTRPRLMLGCVSTLSHTLLWVSVRVQLEACHRVMKWDGVHPRTTARIARASAGAARACLAKGVGESGQSLQETHGPQQVCGVRHAGVHCQQLLELRGLPRPAPGVKDEELEVGEAGPAHGCRSDLGGPTLKRDEGQRTDYLQHIIGITLKSISGAF